jgi:hypothetical protein
MTKLKLSAITDDKPVKLTLELPAAVHRELVAYADVLERETGQPADPARLIAPMVTKFMASDRGFAKARRVILRSSSTHSSISGKKGLPPT